jgi:4-hydroxyphenylpyruvate dioxygenase
MRKSIATVSLSGILTEKLDAIAAAGFDGVEIFEQDLLTSPLRPEDVRQLLADLGLTLELFQPFRDFEAVPPDRLRANLRRARHKLALMERLGATHLMVCSNVGADSVDDDELAAEQLAQLADLAAVHGVRVSYEALAWGRWVNDYEHAWRIIELAGHPALGTCLDSFHILSRGSDPAAIETIPGEKIFFLQLADAPVMSMDVLQWSRHHRCFPGQGGLDVAALTAHALRAGYRGPLSLEVFNDVFRQSPAARTAVDAFRSLVALEEGVQQRLGPQPAARRRLGTPEAGPIRLTPPPPAVVPSGFAFAELSLRSEDELDGFLTALGFHRTGQHRTKPVALWEQGHARVLTNADHRFPEPGLSAIGLESVDPRAAVERATALRSPVLPRGRAADEIVLDSIAAPDGTSIFFCRTEQPDHPSWTEDFDRRAGRLAGVGIERIDHVALTQPWKFFNEATLFYRSVLGLEPYHSLDVPDPYGLLRSRAVASDDGAVRLALNVLPPAYSPRDAAGRRRPTQHVAFVSRDIMRTARALRDNGAQILTVSDNYYGDLAARYDLDPSFIDELRALGLLYDREGAGEFLQLFTVTRGRIFFEIVQRSNGYDGYGAANAPFRLAAQHQHSPATRSLDRTRDLSVVEPVKGGAHDRP